MQQRNNPLTQFKVDGIEYQLFKHEDGEVVFVSVHRYNDPWTWEDEEEWNYDRFHPSHKPLRVIRIMAEHVLTFIRREKPPFIFFKANTSLKHRIYMRLVNRYLPRLSGYEVQDNDGLVYVVKVGS